ncbi:MAG: hypothetical protein CMJ18_13545 [Phycisphaeraceae bacterium]|nr:hypothetical protein [Phycisphaeraceae bacterium]
MGPAGDQIQKRTLAAAAEGDPDAWRTLVGDFTPRVFALLVRQCGDRDLAEEIVQDTFVKVATRIGRDGQYREQGRFEAWLFRIAMNRLRDEMRRRRRQAIPVDFGPGSIAAETSSGPDGAALVDRSGPDPLESASRSEMIERLGAAMEQLGDADREILHLRHTAGLSFPQIAETLDQPLGTVLARGHRALKKLRKIMEEQEL